MSLAIVRDHFGAHADAISGRCPVPIPLTLNLTLIVKCLVKFYGRVSCPGRLAIVSDHFCTRSDAISGQYPVPCRLPLILTWKSQMPGQRSSLCTLLKEASYRLRPFWYMC